MSLKLISKRLAFIICITGINAGIFGQGNNSKEEELFENIAYWVYKNVEGRRDTNFCKPSVISFNGLKYHQVIFKMENGEKAVNWYRQDSVGIYVYDEEEESDELVLPFLKDKGYTYNYFYFDAVLISKDSVFVTPQDTFSNSIVVSYSYLDPEGDELQITQFFSKSIGVLGEYINGKLNFFLEDFLRR